MYIDMDKERMIPPTFIFWVIYRQASNVRHTLGNKIVDHSDVVGASPVSAAPATSSLLTSHLASIETRII